ncbi:hypothetical protein EJB05_03733 [Eragrostis curvula]|uniref:Uncharacterized protein n=1 Tax=Eragrostis curvula TaxID=38414 RepID=A0A5J9W8N6_9POAL|nr:hypothetical protein EJB05_03733 [Eragrostis curvula]
MAAATRIAGMLRSVASKLARAPPPPRHRLPALRGGFPRCSSRPFSSGSNKDLTQDKKVVSMLDISNDSAIAKMTYFLMFGSVIFIYGWMLPAMDRINNKLDATSIREDEIIQVVTNECLKMNDLLIEQRRKSMERHIGARDVLANYSETQPTQTSGKERGGAGAV